MGRVFKVSERISPEALTSKSPNPSSTTMIFFMIGRLWDYFDILGIENFFRGSVCDKDLESSDLF